MFKDSDLHRLTDRESQIVILATHGLTDKEIGTHLRISGATVMTHWSKIRVKMGTSCRTSAVATMAAAVARAAARKVLNHESLTGELAEDEAIVTDKGIVLVIGEDIERFFSTRAGLTLNPGRVEFKDDAGDTVVDEKLAWNMPVSCEDHYRAGVRGSSKLRDLHVKSERFKDPIFGELSLVRFGGLSRSGTLA